MKQMHRSRHCRGKEPPCSRQKQRQELEQEQRQEPRQLMIGLEDAQALVLILKTWLTVLQKMAEQAPELDADIFSLRSLLLRLGRFGEQEDGELLLTYFDLEAIDLALTSFGDLLRKKVPQSDYRDMVLQSIDWLYDQFAGLH